MKQLLFTLFALMFLLNAQAQNVAINNDGSTADPNAMLDVKSSSKGALLPRVAALTNITGNVPLGLIVFVTDGNRGFYYNASALQGTPNWKKISTGDDNYWQYTSPNYLFWNGTANVGIGTSTPSMPLHVSKASDTALMVLENNTALAADVSASLYFKTGAFYTGSIRSVGSGPGAARLAISTWASTNRNGLREGISLLDNGNVGIGTITPDEGGLVVDRKVGAVHAMFGSNTSGVTLESAWPGIAFNSYYNGSRKLLAGGYGSWMGLNPDNGDFYLQTTTATATAGATVSPVTRMFINRFGNIGIEGNTNPQSPLSFANNTGEKINFYEVGANANYGIGISGAQMKVYTGGAGDAISFGYGSNATFTERVRMQNGYTTINNGRLQFKGSYGANAHGIDFTNNSGSSSRGFMGMLDDNTMGFYGYGGTGWSFLWDVNDGSLRLGTTQKASGYMLNIGGRAIAEEVRVQLRAAWPDYVFKKEYRLMPLPELEKFIAANNHLPNIPKAELLEKEGTDLGEMQRKMMEKIEELTLYVIELKKEIVQLKENRPAVR